MAMNPGKSARQVPGTCQDNEKHSSLERFESLVIILEQNRFVSARPDKVFRPENATVTLRLLLDGAEAHGTE